VFTKKKTRLKRKTGNKTTNWKFGPSMAKEFQARTIEIKDLNQNSY
jgi:hypothetical protein